MVFWSDYPNAISYRNTFFPSCGPFQSTLFEKEAVPSPTGIPSILITYHAPLSLRNEVCTYLRTYFGNPPHTPLFVLKGEELLKEKDVLFLVRDNTQIVGTLRYYYTGQLITNAVDIYRVDAFCIHPQWRKKGVGDYLLTQLHCYANEKSMPYAMFLKEGSPLFISSVPFYTGQYVFREVSTMISSSSFIHTISTEKAHQLLDIYHRIYPHVCIIRNQQTPQQWRMYKKGYYMIIACFQDTHQWKDGGRMGWCTAWLESSVMTEDTRKEAAIAITDSLSNSFDYVWMHKCHIETSSLENNLSWKEDGYFHWYTYQWTTTLSVEPSFCIMD